MGRPSRGLRVYVVAAAAVFALALPAGAHADGTVSISGSTLTYVETIDSINFVQFTDGGGGNIRVTETLNGQTLTAGTGCVPFGVTGREANCPAAGITLISGQTFGQTDSLNTYLQIPSNFAGGDGDDSFGSNYTGPDTFNGGNGSDIVDYQLHASAVTGDLGAGTVTGATTGNDALTNIEELQGTSAAGDTLIGDGNDNALFGQGGTDTISGGAGVDNIQGGPDDDLIDGGPGGDVIQGLGGTDTISYASETAGVNVFLTGSAQTVSGTDGVTTFENIRGSPFADNLQGDGAINVIEGGDGNDQLHGGGGDDDLRGQNGTADVASWEFDNLPIVASLVSGTATGNGSDVLTTIEGLTGGSASDDLTGNGAANPLSGNGGNDFIEGGAGADAITGGSGIDRAIYTNEVASVTVDLITDTATGASAGNDSVVTVESVEGSPNDDVIRSRDSAAGSVDCGAGTDQAVADASATDTLSSCETVAPIATGNPAVAGTVAIGQPLTASIGTWEGTASAKTYEWRTCNSAGASCAGIPGETAASYVPTADQATRTFRVAVTGTNAAGTGTAQSAATSVLAAPPLATTAPATADPPASPPAGPAQADTPLPTPAFTRTANAEPVSGAVLVRAPGTKAFVPLARPEQVRVGSIIDARKGRVRLTTIDAKGKLQTAEFYEGMFRLLQPRNARGVTELRLFGGSFAPCPKVRPARLADVSRVGKRKSLRRLWGDGKGLFRTRGRYAAASLRGTTWLTDDRCDGTLTRVTRGSVTVRDLPRRKNILLRAPRRYLATPLR